MATSISLYCVQQRALLLMLALLHILVPSCSAQHKARHEVCKTCKTPAWGWETVGHMAFTHTCNVSGPWSEEALDVLSKFPLVNIERFMGQHERCFATHREQWGPPGGWLNHTHGSPACSHATSPAAGAAPPGCNCTVEEAPLGLTADATGKFVEDHTIAALKQLKQRNPNITTIFYHDTGRMWTNDQPSAGHGAPDSGRVPPQSTKYWNPTVYRADNAIVRNNPEWLLKNNTSGYVYDHYANNHIYDHSKQAVQDYWIEICLNATSTGWADGCFGDYASMGGNDPAMPGQKASVGVAGVMKSWNLTEASAEAWVNGHQAALSALKKALGKGTLVANGGQNPHASGFMLETFMPASYAQIQSGVKAGLVNEVHTNMYQGAKNPDVRDALAAFLIGTGPLAYFSGPYGWQISQTWSDPTGIEDIKRRWLPEFDKSLGEAKGQAVYDATTQLVTREFASGTKATFDHSNNQGTIEWSDGTMTKGPGCPPSAKSCQQCEPPDYKVCTGHPA